MTFDGRGRMAEVFRAAAPLVLLCGVAAVLWLFPPAQYGVYPECPIYRYLHVECPGCGATRALAALLHGDVREAVRLNALATVLVLPGLVYAVVCYRRFLQRRDFYVPRVPGVFVYSGLVVAGVFAVVRNIGRI